MPIHPTQPMFITGKLCWDIHGDGPKLTFWVMATALKSALGLRPRARDDEAKALTLARRNWAVLELIARDAMQSGRVTERGGSKGWSVHYDIDDEAFMHLFSRYESQFVM
jgi:hypothetical protein